MRRSTGARPGVCCVLATLKLAVVSAERHTDERGHFVSMRTFFDIQDDAPGGGRGSRSRLAGEGGFTLIEALVATVVLVIGLMGIFSLLNVANKAGAQTRAREGATNLARQILEDARTIPYSQISPASIVKELKKMNGLGTIESGSISRRESETQKATTYAVTVEACAIDDPKDGVAKTHGGSFCKEPAQEDWKEGTVDSQPEDLKRITVAVKWTALGRAPAVKQVETLTAAGQAIGLDSTALELTNPTCPGTSCESSPMTPVIIADAPKLTFSVAFPAATTAIRWSLEGSRQEELTVSEGATSGTFSWPIDEPPLHPKVSDGTYQVSVQAVNATGVIGPPTSISVRLIRSVPAAPRSVEGGFNTVYVSGVATKVVELQWQANTERNVIGYRVYNPSKQLVCPSAMATLSLTTSCIVFPPSQSEGVYSVAALYRNAKNEVAESPATSLSATVAASKAPGAPTKLTATKEENGSVKLSWTAPAGGAAFYRVYRATPGTYSGSPNYTSRYETSTSTTFTDTEAFSEHQYWVTAVSSTLTESAFLGPVTK
jgi:Tfp pilus assembly protein PilV